MTPTTDQIIDAILEREEAPCERGRPWTEIIARLAAHDHGGWTRAGITAADYGAYRGWDRVATPEELNALSESDVRSYYRTRYVWPLAFTPEPLRSLLVDWAVTSWFDDPVKALQQSLVRRGVYHGLIDGVAGPQTKDALLHDPSPRDTYREIVQARIRFYVDLGTRRDPSQIGNVLGWVNRALEFLL